MPSTSPYQAARAAAIGSLLLAGAWQYAAAGSPAAATAGSAGACTTAATARHASGAAVALTARNRPQTCVQSTGFATSETTIAVTPAGAVYYSPANTENTVATSSGAGGWQLSQPQLEEATSLWNTVDPYVVADPRTGRTFWLHATGPTRTTPLLVDESPLGNTPATVLAAAYGFQVYATDNGRDWTTANYRTEPMGDWEKLFVGPPPAGASAAEKPTGYPDVVYVCGNSPFEVSGPGRLCEKSLDGGLTFTRAGYIFPSASVPDYCSALGAENGLVTSTGTVVQPVSCSQADYVAVSNDEGSSYTWHVVPKAPGGTSVQLAADRGNGLYAMWLSGDKLFVSRSTDLGAHWTSPWSVAAPGVHAITIPTITAGPTGAFAVAYYGSTTSSSYLTGFVTTTTQGRTANPVLVTSTVGTAAHPLLYATGFNASPRADYIGATYDRFGRVWVALPEQTTKPDSNNAVHTAGLVVRVTPAT